MIYVVATLSFIIGVILGIAIGALAAYKPEIGKLKIKTDEDGTYCFLVLKRHPDELKDGNSIILIVDKDATRK